MAAIFDLTGWTRERAVQAKAGRTISLCIPCRDEANTIGGLVTLAKNALGGPNGLVDEIIVLDDRSIDGSADVARGAGATVVPISEVHEKHGEGRGKGNALWASLIVSKGDIVVWCDADVTSFDGGYGSAYLAKMVGQKKAREIFFLGRNYSAQDAFEMGMVNAVIPHAELEDTAYEWAQEILAKSPTSIKMLKFAMNLTDDGMVGQQVFAGEATRLAYMTDEAKEGRDAFLEKRKPNFEKKYLP